MNEVLLGLHVEVTLAHIPFVVFLGLDGCLDFALKFFLLFDHDLLALLSALLGLLKLCPGQFFVSVLFGCALSLKCELKFLVLLL